MKTEPLSDPYRALFAYLTSGSDHHLCVEPNGSWYVKPYNITEMSDPIGTIYISCCNIGDLDSTWWTEGYAERHDDGLYYELESGNLIGELDDVIHNCIEEGDVESNLESLECEVEQQRKDAAHDLEMHAYCD